ncbi:hypothetical protein [Streptomyces sp. NPDC089919]|uniref:hypothetical protein n=1 Tax=Streptomyces sp. NPDC089919 TaxID=3155188 RepID=UPI00341498B9
MNRYWAEGIHVEPTWDHHGDESWFGDRMVRVAGHLFPPRFRIFMKCDASQVEMCIALQVDQGGFIEQENGTTVHGVSSDQQKDQVRAAARKLALPLALAMIPFGAARETETGWEWVAAAWSPPAARKVGEHLAGAQLLLLKELRRRTGAKWWDIYLPRIEETAFIVACAPSEKSTRAVIVEDVCPRTCVSRTQAYLDLHAARELGLIPPARCDSAGNPLR